MNSKGRVRLRNRRLLSNSLPDVTDARTSRTPPPPPSILSSSNPNSPSKAATNGSYDIDDETWADSVNQRTGECFHIDVPLPPPSHHHHHADDSSAHRLRSSSSSSLSSGLSITETPPPSLHGASIMRERLSLSIGFHSDRASSPTPEREEQFPPSLPPSGSPGHHGHRRRVSIGQRIKNLSRHTKTRSLSEGLGSGMSQSFTDLHDFSRPPRHRAKSSLAMDITSPPHGSLYGSHGLPLPHPASTLITVRINIAQYRLGVDVDEGNPCSLEALGIVPARSLGQSKFGSLSSLRFSFKSHYPPSALGHPLVIRGVVAGSPAALTQQLHQGDTVVSVNGQKVDLESINSILSCATGELLLVVRKQFSLSPLHSLPRPHKGEKERDRWDLPRLVTGKQRTIQKAMKTLVKFPHILLYLTLDTREDDPPEKDIIYRYPTEESWCLDKLVQLRGLFLTLSDVMGSITGATSSCSTILLDDQLVHLGYIQYGKEMLMVAMLASVVSHYQVQLLVESIERTLQLLYNSVQMAFSSPEHSSTLNHLFSLMFDQLLRPSPHPHSSLPGTMTAAQLSLHSDLKMRLSAALSGLDSANHTNRPEILHLRRPYHLSGSCLFYRGALACSHLSSEDQRDVVTFCEAHRLLELTATESINQIVIWREIHLTRVRNTAHGPIHPVYREKRGRWFILVVGLEHVVLCMLMEQCHVTIQAPPTVDAVYIDRARALIMELRAGDLLTQCEGKATASIPSLFSADIALASLFTSASRQKRLSRQLSNAEVGSDSDEQAGGVHDWQYTRKHSFGKAMFKPRRQELSSNHLSRASQSLSRTAYTITAGLDTMLLHYLTLDTGRGVMLCPTHTTPPGALQAELLQCFHRCCLTVRSVLRSGRTAGGAEQDSDSSDSDIWSDEEEEREKEGKTPASPFSQPSSSPVVEHGVMFQCSVRGGEGHSGGGDKAKHPPTLNYWVIGRLLPCDSELYVCYQDNMSQNIVEMAFRLLFGTPG